MLTRDQLLALNSLALWEVEAVRAIARSAFHALEVWDVPCFRRLCDLMMMVIGPFEPKWLVIVSNQLTIHWVERTPSLKKQRQMADPEFRYIDY